VLDQTSGATHTPGYEGEAGEWCRTITFANSTTPMSASINNDKIYLAPANTFTITAQTLNADGTTTAGSPVDVPRFFSHNTAVATVGQTSGIVTAVANNSTYITSLVPFVTGTDLATDGSGNATSASNPFNYGEGPLNGNAQWGCYISGGTGFTVGFYSIVIVQYLGGTYGTGATFGIGAGLPANLTGGHYSCGPTAQSWIFVWSQNILPYIGSDASINTSYNASNAAIVHGSFGGINLLFSDQPYNYQGHANGAAYEFNNIGNWWAFETGAGCAANCSFSDTIPTSGTYASWQASLNSSIATTLSYLQGQPNLYLYLHWETISNSAVNLYGACCGPGATLSPPAPQYMFQAYANTGKILSNYWHDEIGISTCPMCGPIVYDPAGTGTGQSWLISLTCTGGGGAGEVCTAAVGPNGYAISFNEFIIHGSAVTNMNSVYPALYTGTAHTGGGFTFPCANVADGTYNSSNDPGFTLEPMTLEAWVNSTSYVPNNALAIVRGNLAAITGHMPFSGRPAGDSIGGIVTNGVCSSAMAGNTFRNWSGYSSFSIGGYQAGDFAGVYNETGAQGYIVSRPSLNANVNNSGWLGWTLRNLYGCGYSPSLPLQALTEGTLNYYGVRGIPVPLASCVGTLCTFSAPHGITNIISGLTRMYVTGATDVSSPQNTTNNNFVIVDCPTPTTCNVDLAATDQTQNGNFSAGNNANSGTITTQDGTMVTMQGTGSVAGGMSATGILSCTSSGAVGVTSGNMCNADQMRPLNATGAGSATTLLRKRGQTFSFNGTAAGTGASYFNGRTFRIIPDWLNVASAPNTQVFYRQLPVLNSTGGTAYIITDDNYYKGLSGSTGPGGTAVGPAASGSGDINPEFFFDNTFECILLGCSGEDIYQFSPNPNGYSDQGGFTAGGGAYVQWGPKVFANNATFQTTLNQHFENGAAVPGFKAHQFAALYWNRYKEYWLQPRLNAPSIGKPGEIDCGAAAGTYGNILACMNATDGPRTLTIPLTPYLESGQQIIEQVVDAYGIGAITTLSSGSASATVTLQPSQAVSLVFPVNFAAELQQPTIGARLADVANASQVAVRFSYDPYYLDTRAGNVYNCGTGTCTPAWDRNTGAIYFRLIYLGPSSSVLATSAVQTF